jgi:uncharacterized Fe-S cluster protein YjdI
MEQCEVEVVKGAPLVQQRRPRRIGNETDREKEVDATYACGSTALRYAAEMASEGVPAPVHHGRTV